MTLEEAIEVKCLTDTMYFTRYFFKQRFKKKYIVGKHHHIISDLLDRVYKGELTRLCIRVAPRYGKTELAVKNFIAKGLALNPKSKYIHLSYSDDLALDNSSEIKDFVQEDSYQEIFPYVQLKKDAKAKKRWSTTDGGGVYATSTAGQVTGFGAGLTEEEEDGLDNFIGELNEAVSILGFGGAIVIDDPIKPEDALSDTKRNKINNRFYSTIYNRVNSRKTPIVIIAQATHEEDLIGYVMKQEPGVWELVSIPCLTTNEAGEEESLYPEKHTVEELHRLRDADAFVFNTQYQQDPKPLEGLLLPKEKLQFVPMKHIPEEYIVYKFSIVDPADKGGDKYSVPYLHVVQYEDVFKVYVRSVVHNKLGIEANTSRVINKCKEYAIEHLFVEKNGVGLSALFELSRESKDTSTAVKDFTSSTEKIVRIISNYEFIQKYFVFDSEYEADSEYKEFINDLTSFLKEGDNKHKMDAIDILSSAAYALKIKYKQFLHGS